MCSVETTHELREHETTGSLGGNGVRWDKGRNQPARNIASGPSRGKYNAPQWRHYETGFERQSMITNGVCKAPEKILRYK